MSKTNQLRHEGAELHRKLEVRGATAGLSLSDYLIAEIRRSAARPTCEEIRARLASREPVEPSPAPADAVRSEREDR